jgi:hypothetical protein
VTAESRSGILFSGNQPSPKQFFLQDLIRGHKALGLRGRTISVVERGGW